ncbi:lipid transferase CIDEB-like [Haemorhous mexicanus]|uniref:lipid transferase CIDEB-like n=1 Tax=Haemorhous mexicanus TaxID=30427 RepID=UPI0028BEC167|nr:lipid transferase CIDEB-like [Haemorhous mexicanus]
MEALRPAGGEGRPRGVLAASLGELRQQARSALALPLPPALALAEDGTLVEDEEFFGTLPPHAALQALGPGQRWEPPRAPPPWDLGRGLPEEPPGGPPELARLSLLRDRDHPGGARLRLQGRLRGLRWELGGLGPHSLLRELLRLLVSLSRALGQALLGVSAALRPLLEGPQTHGEGH